MPQQKKKLLATGLALGLLGLVGLAALYRSATYGQGNFTPERLKPPQQPIAPMEIRPARDVASHMSPSELVLGVDLVGEARAYPVNMMAGPNWKSQVSQEVLNDQLGGVAIAVTWCEFCHTGAVYARDVEGRELTFGVAGQLWKGNLVMYDRETGTLWSQFMGEGERGPLQGKKLRRLPVVKTDWQSWYAQYPQGTVALLKRNSQGYRTELYAHIPKELVLGMASEETAKAWSFRRLKKEPALNDEFDGQPVLAVFESKSYTARLYARTLDDRVLTFHVRDGMIVDDQTGSDWELVSGRAVGGPLAGKSLTPLPATVCLLTSWLDFRPSSALVP